jgi:hypothetical protein
LFAASMPQVKVKTSDTPSASIIRRVVRSA